MFATGNSEKLNITMKYKEIDFVFADQTFILAV